MTVNRLHSLQQPYLSGRHVFPLQRRGIQGDKSAQLFGKQLRIGLSHIAAHGLPDYDRFVEALPNKDLIQPPRLVEQIESKGERPGGGMPGSVPDKDRAAPLKTLDLLVKESVICGQPRQEDQLRSGPLRVRIHPVVNRAAGRQICAFNHKRNLLNSVLSYASSAPHKIGYFIISQNGRFFHNKTGAPLCAERPVG